MTEVNSNKDDARKFVEGQIDKFIKGDILSHIQWVAYAYPLSDLRDVALGYVVGLIFGKYEGHCLLTEISEGSRLQIRDTDVVMRVFKEKLPEIIDKIEKEFGT